MAVEVRACVPRAGDSAMPNQTDPLRANGPARATPGATPPGQAPAPAGQANAPGQANAGAAPGPVALTADTVQEAVRRGAPNDLDIAQPFMQQVVAANTTDEQFRQQYADTALLKHKIIKAYLDQAPGSAGIKKIGEKDPVAVQKFADIDGENYLDNPGLKDQYWTDLAAKLKEPAFTDRTRVYPVMSSAIVYPYQFKGKQIPADLVSPHSSRNQSVDKLFDIKTNDAEVDRQLRTELMNAGVSDTIIARDNLMQDANLRKKAYRHLLKAGADPLTTINRGAKISDYPAWYKPGEITVPGGSADTVYAKMMQLGALQPEWYPNGTVVLNIQPTLAAGSRELRKPTCFDGMMSSLWVARNQPGEVYGVTGGGIGEFLEKGITYAEVTSATAVVPNDDFLADIQRVASQVKNAGLKSTATEEMVRGNGGNVSIMNTSPGVSQMYRDIVGTTRNEAQNPGARPDAPGSQRPVPGAGTRPGTPAAAPGGAYDPARPRP
jgi:hypothetical protein